MATWSILRGADELNLSDRDPFDLVSAIGIGSAPVRRLVERGPFQDGDSDLGYRLDARLISLVVASVSATRADADAARDLLWSFVKPLAGSVTLRCVRDDGATRQIDVYPTDIIDAPVTEEDRIGAFQRYAVQLRAPSPIWYSPEGASFAAIGGAATGASGFQVPTDVPTVQVPLTTIDVAQSLTYPGTWPEFPRIILYGPGTGYTVENETTGEVLDFPALGLSSGEYVVIDLGYGAKSVTDDTGANVIDELDSDSDLATWHLEAAPNAPGGVNTIRLTVDADASDETGMKIEYTPRYVAL